MHSESINCPRDKYDTNFCRVCGSDKASNHYDVICCSPCKMFFRRNAYVDLTNVSCEFDRKCDINKASRRDCRVCRMKKCLSVGMKMELFRPTRTTFQTNQRKCNHLPTPNEAFVSSIIRPLDLLYQDRSLLSVEQWSLLSNAVHCYDIHSPTQQIQQAMSPYQFVPPKSRLKIAASNLMVTLNLFFSSTWSFVEAVPHYKILPLFIRQNLMQRNIHQIGALSGAHICQEGKFHDDPTNQSVGFAEYGSLQMQLMLEAIQLGISDRTISKLFLLIMCLSTASDTVQMNMENNLSWIDQCLFEHTIQIYNIQNIFVDVFFKYMIYRLGYFKACIYFAHIIKNTLVQGAYLQKAQTNSNHYFMIQNIIQRFQKSQTIHQQSTNTFSVIF